MALNLNQYLFYINFKLFAEKLAGLPQLLKLFSYTTYVNNFNIGNSFMKIIIIKLKVF